MEDNLILYKRFLNTITEILDKRFEEQKEYIHCKKGCSHCCEKGVYPYSKVEAEYLLMGLLTLETSKRQQVIDRIKALKQTLTGEEDFKHFMYRCPLLSENGCCEVYSHRGIICRTFGLLKCEDDKVVLPFCHSLGLNYSEAYDPQTNSLVQKPEFKQAPKAYNITLKNLKDKNLFENMPDFGETKSLIEWL